MSSSYTFNFADNVRNENTAKVLMKAQNKLNDGGSILEALAMILGVIANDMADKVFEKAGALDTKKGGNENELTAELQALTQQMNMFIQAMNNAIKTLGEAQGTLARKG